MLPLSRLSTNEARQLKGVFFDLDDTFLDGGLLRESAVVALFSLANAGLRLIALTGRPAAWGEMVARMWPVEAAIAENGALAFYRSEGRTLALDTTSRADRSARRTALDELVAEVKARFPFLVPSDDVGGRVSDYTFDIGEHERVDADTVRRVREYCHARGARTTGSSVHLHVTFDRCDKATGALAYLRARGEDETRARRQFAFIGDSDNDAPAFAAFQSTVGVENVHGHFSIPPRYITTSPKSAGFSEFAAHLLNERAP